MNILATGAWQGYSDNQNVLKELGHETAYLPWEKDPLPVDPAWVEGIIGNGIFQSHPIGEFTNLKYIQLTSAGYDRVPMDYVKEHGIAIHNARGVYSIPMAEFAVSGVLSMYKKLPVFFRNQCAKLWEKQRDLMELYGKSVLILGCGSVGTECAKRFAAFGCGVRGIDLYPREDAAYKEILGMERFEKLLPEADIIIIALPLTENTRHLLDRERLDLLKPGAVLVNISRGAVIDTSALTDALKERKIRGAVLDVFEEEPLSPENPLWEMENVILTPHNSFTGEGNRERLDRVIIENLKKAALRGPSAAGS